MKRRVESTAGKSIFTFLLAVLLMALFASTSAFAQEPANQTESWHFGVTIYGWFPNITGQTAFTPPRGSSDFEIDIDDILDNLEFVLMGTFDVGKGRWGVLTDLIYMDVGGSETGTREASIGGNPLPINATANVDFDMKSWVWTIVGYYRALDKPGLTLDVVAGARYLDVEQSVNWIATGNVGSIPVPVRTGAAEADVAIWDALIGARGRFAFGPKKAWFIPYYLDVGTGESDFTLQGVAGLGYSFGWVEAAAVWRYLYYDLPSGKAINDISFSGPAIGVIFRW